MYTGGRIELKDVSFRVLKDVSFTIEPGTKLGIVGPSGSGKSTVLKVLYKQYLPDSGEVLVDGQKLSDLEDTSYLQRVGIVTQEPLLFNETLRFNLKYGNPDATEEQLVDCCKRAQIHDVIEETYEHGYGS